MKAEERREPKGAQSDFPENWKKYVREAERHSEDTLSLHHTFSLTAFVHFILLRTLWSAGVGLKSW